MSQMLVMAAEAVADASLPSWVERISAVGLIILFGLALARNWLYTSGQVDKLLEAERRVSELWKQNAETHSANAERLTDSIEPVITGNAAILRAVEQIQREQLAQRFQSRQPGDH